MNWRGVLLENLGFKVVAVVVVAMLWMSVTADERQAQPVSTALSIELRDTAWVLVDSPEEVSTTFQGRNRELLGLLMAKPVARIVVDSVTGDRMRVAVPVDRVDYDRETGAVPSFITPQAVDLRFERRRSRRVPVEPDIEAVPAAGYTVVQPFGVEPDSVTVQGPATWVEGLTRVTTRELRLDELTHTLVRDVPLELPVDVRGVRVDPATVLVTISVDSLVVRELRVPLRVTGAAAGSALVSPDSVTVSLRGVAAAVAAAARQIDAVTVDVPSAPRRNYQVSLSVEVEAEGPVAVNLEPATATLGPRP